MDEITTMDEAPTPTTTSGSPAPQEHSSSPAPPPPKKRKVSVDPATGPKQTKRRAARACTSCRNRKVRCDVVEGSPCNNCRWDNVPCEVQESRRRKKHFPQQPPNPQTLQANGLAMNSPHGLPLQGVNPSQIMDGFPVHPLFPQQHPMHARAQSVGHGGFLSQMPAPIPMHAPVGRWPPDHAALPRLLGDPGMRLQPRSIDELGLPPFIKKPMKVFSSPELFFLQSQGSTLMLAPRIQNLLLEAYIEYVHPYMPMVDLRAFVAGLRGQGRVSLLLYYAVAFAASAFVNPDELLAANFPDRKEARKILFNRTRLLYERDWEDDKITKVQALLLMSYWYESPLDDKDTWHWMGNAVGLASIMGLDKDPSRMTNLTPEERKLRRRVWWCCYMRDHMIALGMRRPMRIHESHFHVPVLEMDDFDFGPVTDDHHILPGSCKAAHDVDTQRLLAGMCVRMMHLTQLVERVLSVQYLASGQSGVGDPNHMLHPNKKLDNLAEVKAIQDRLQAWYAALPPELAWQEPQGPVSPSDGSLFLQITLLHLVYYAAFAALHRPFYQLLPAGQEKGDVVLAQQQQSQKTLTLTAIKVSKMVEVLRQHDLVRRMPTTAVTVILPSIVVLLINLRLGLPAEEAARTKACIQSCHNALKQLDEIYPAAGFAVTLVASAMRMSLGKMPVAPPKPESQPQLQPQPLSQLQLQPQPPPPLQQGATGPLPGPIPMAESTPPPDSVQPPDPFGIFAPKSFVKNPYDGQATNSPPPSDLDSPYGPADDVYQDYSFSNDVLRPEWIPHDTETGELDISQYVDFTGEGLAAADGLTDDFSMFNSNGDQWQSF